MKNGRREGRQSSSTNVGGTKDWLQDAMRPEPITWKRGRRKKPGNAGSEPGTKIQRTLAAYVSAWKWPK